VTKGLQNWFGPTKPMPAGLGIGFTENQSDQPVLDLKFEI
jgi:hypothetical protein